MNFLVADDDLVCRELLMDILSQYGDCTLATDGADAVDAFRQALEQGNRFDAVLLDIMMPDVDGREALKRIRSLELEFKIHGEDRVVVIMVSALDDLEHVITCVGKGCHSYVTKPVDENQLLVELTGALGRPLTEVGTSNEQPHPEPAPVEEVSGQSRFLIVDDDYGCRELLKDILLSYGVCDIATNGAEAVETFKEALEQGIKYDAVMLDIMMPDMRGHEALTHIREIEDQHGIYCLSGTKVLMATALKDPPHIFKAFRNGCEAYIVKPICEEELLGKLRELGALADAALACV